jgi:cell division protein FtsB
MVVRPYIVTAILLALLLALQAQLWFGRGSMPAVEQLKARLEQLEHDNAASRLANEQLASEVSDLQEGLEVIEAYARQELGMVKANEIFVQYAQPSADAELSPAPTPVASSSKP